MTDDQHQQDPPEEPSPKLGPGRHPTFAHALLAAQADAPNLARRRKHYDGYMYASAADVKDVLLPILREHGLVAEMAHADSIMDEKELETRQGGLQWMTDLLVTFRVHHVGTGQTQEYRILARRSNDKDKGIQHAMSSAEKSFYLRLLGVSEEDDEEGPDHRVDQSTGSRRKKKSGKRRPRREPPNAPPPQPRQQNGNPAPPADTATDEEIITWAQARVRQLMKQGRFRRYHMEAVAAVDSKLRERIDVWNPSEWKHMEELARRWPQRFDEAVTAMGKKEPTTRERLQELNELLQRCSPDLVPTQDRAMIHSAAEAGWHDAVEWWIAKLEDLLA